MISNENLELFHFGDYKNLKFWIENNAEYTILDCKAVTEYNITSFIIFAKQTSKLTVEERMLKLDYLNNKL